MKIRTLIPALLLCLWVIPAQAFPPAPYYQIFGTVRNEDGRPLASGEGTVILSGAYSALNTATVSGGGITGVTITNGGSGYTSAPEVSFIGAHGLGTGATGTATLSNGVVSSITVTDPGSGYTSPVIVSFSDGNTDSTEITRSITSSLDGINYSLSVPMDSGILADFNDLSAMSPYLPFTINVVIDGQSYLPMQIASATDPFWITQIDAVNSPGIYSQGSNWAVGLPADKLRLDLTLGIDGDGDGMPDSWEEQIVDALGLSSITEVNPNGDSDGDGVSNYFEYIAGTYAFDKGDKFELNIIDVTQSTLGEPPVEYDIAHLQFLTIPGRTYKILEWTGIGEPTVRDFSLTPDLESLIPSLAATDVNYLDVYIPDTDGKVHLFILTVE